MKVIKRILIGILCSPFILIGLLILFEIFGMIVNHVSTGVQTNRLKQNILKEIPAVEIIDTYSETGNTSGTGNHVDMLSVVIFKTNSTKTEIESKLNNVYDLTDEWGCWVEDISIIKERHEKYCFGFSYYDKLNIPENLENCYMIYLNERAPFVDNIEGH